jgi:hypothetical protein
MPSIDTNERSGSAIEVSVRLSGDLFDQVLCPLAAARKSAGAPPYFPLWRDVDVSSYFGAPDVGKMTSTSFEYPGGGAAEGLVDALTEWWSGEDEATLSAAGPQLQAIVGALRDEAKLQDATVDIFCYTLF